MLLRSPIVTRSARRFAHYRLRRLAGTEFVSWAIRVPLVTIAITAAMLLLVPRLARSRPRREA
jgi:hypothetical protein